MWILEPWLVSWQLCLDGVGEGQTGQGTDPVLWVAGEEHAGVSAVREDPSTHGWWAEDAKSWGTCQPQTASHPRLPLRNVCLSEAPSFQFSRSWKFTITSFIFICHLPNFKMGQLFKRKLNTVLDKQGPSAGLGSTAYDASRHTSRPGGKPLARAVASAPPPKPKYSRELGRHWLMLLC